MQPRGMKYGKKSKRSKMSESYHQDSASLHFSRMTHMVLSAPAYGVKGAIWWKIPRQWFFALDSDFIILTCHIKCRLNRKIPIPLRLPNLIAVSASGIPAVGRNRSGLGSLSSRNLKQRRSFTSTRPQSHHSPLNLHHQLPLKN